MKFSFAKITACFIAWLSWVTQAFQIPAIVRKQFQYGASTQLYRSLSGIISASSTSLSSLSSLSITSSTVRKHDTKMISIDRTNFRQPSTMSFIQSWLPSWMGGGSAFATRPQSPRSESSFSTQNELSEDQFQQAKAQFMQQRLSHRAIHEDADSHHLRGMHVAGYMDYDPKVAARSAYQRSGSSGLRRENSWFSS